MKNFVKLIKQVHEERYSKVLTKVVSNKIPVAFLSLAPTGQATEIVKDFRAQGLNITMLVVNDNTLPQNYLEFDVVHVNKAAQIYPHPEYVFTVGQFDTRFALKNFPTSKVSSLKPNRSEEFYEAFMTHLPELQEFYESLIDEQSKKTFCGYWLGNISNRLNEIVHSNSAHYLISGFIPERGGIVIDGGACDGGTSTVLSEMGYKVYGFEMDRLNYEIAFKVAEEKNFVVENLGLGSHKHKMTYIHNEQNIGSSKLDFNGSEIAQIITLDSYVREKNLPSVDLIKLDVEGAELDVLKGAATTIARFKPILALSVYHKVDDFWTLMNFVKSIRPDYEFALRQSYETPEEEPAHFKKYYIETLTALGLDINKKWFYECVLFAR